MSILKKNWKWWLIVLLLLLGKSYVSTRNDAAEANAAAHAVVVKAQADRKAQRVVTDSFNQSFTGSHLLKPATFASPQVASESLAVVSSYCNSVREYNYKMKTFLVVWRKEEDPSSLMFDADGEWCAAVLNLYSYASDPVHDIQIENGVVLFNNDADCAEFNTLMDKVGAAVDKYKPQAAAK